jgi:hypothetical protein
MSVNKMRERPYDPEAMYIRIAEMQAIVEENKRRMRACDSLAFVPSIRRESSGRKVVTLHDAAQLKGGDMLALCLRRAQDEGRL